MREEVQKTIIAKALRENEQPFALEDNLFRWTGTTNVKSKASGASYEVAIDISIKPSRRVQDQLAACLCKSDGIRFEDFMIVGMIDPKITGKIKMAGLPKTQPDIDFAKFIKTLHGPGDV